MLSWEHTLGQQISILKKKRRKRHVALSSSQYTNYSKYETTDLYLCMSIAWRHNILDLQNFLSIYYKWKLHSFKITNLNAKYISIEVFLEPFLNDTKWVNLFNSATDYLQKILSSTETSSFH